MTKSSIQGNFINRQSLYDDQETPLSVSFVSVLTDWTTCECDLDQRSTELQVLGK